jgi:hypothetical protein
MVAAIGGNGETAAWPGMPDHFLRLFWRALLIYWRLENITRGMAMAKKEELDPETLALIHWCIEVEGFLVAGGATQAEAQEHIEDEVEWFTDLFYDGLTPEEAAKEALA